MKEYAIYLRKSRADLEAEARGEGETLARHRTALRALAEARGLNVVEEYAEIVTGDSIAARPQMQRLLDDVKKGKYAGVIVNDVDRLGRGDSIDQEIIKYTFVAGNCIIITPTREINPASPTDEDMLDFSMFFARFEYRKIKQRLMQGRVRSAMSGNFITSRVPFGYKKVVDGKHITLEPDEEAAEIVRMIFDWYASRKYGYNSIANKLNEMGVRTYRGYPFSRAGIKSMLTNPVYTGRLYWGRTLTISVIEDGHRRKKQIKAPSEPAYAEHAHPAIISDDVFNRVQEMFRQSRHSAPKNINLELKNPFAGIIFCPLCGQALQIRGAGHGKTNDRVVTCVNTQCPTKGTLISILLKATLEILQGWCVQYANPPVEPAQNTAVSERNQALQKQIDTIKGQLAKAQELVELGVYSPTEYLQRKADLQERIEAIRATMSAPTPISTEQAIAAIVPQIESVLEAFPYAQTAEEQNQLFKQVIRRMELYKTQVANKAVPAEQLMELIIYPKIVPYEE